MNRDEILEVFLELSDSLFPDMDFLDNLSVEEIIELHEDVFGFEELDLEEMILDLELYLITR